MRRAFALFSLATLVAVVPRPAEAQDTAVRFPVSEVRGDTSFTFRTGEYPWVRAGLKGIVVDPRQQDMLVARFQILTVADGVARAVVTGQTTSLSTSQSVLLYPPATPWYKQRSFWMGGVVGAAVGAIVGVLVGGD
jgi:hypothetical protein